MRNRMYLKEFSDISSIMTNNVPICREDDTFVHILNLLVEKKYDDIDYVFVVDKNRKLKGVIDLTSVIKARADNLAKEFMQKVEWVLHEKDQRAAALLLSLEHDIDIIPVCDNNGILKGVITSKLLIEMMHQRHFETAIELSGSQKKHEFLSKMVGLGFLNYVWGRASWLFLGICVGLLLGYVSSLFEATLKDSVAIAFFVPVVAYIADSVGTQSEAITIRALATIKVDYKKYVLREFLTGIALGVFMGLIGGIGAFLIVKNMVVSYVVCISLFFATSFATVFASMVPIISRFYGIDPAISSGPISTAIQDVISILIYFLVANLII